MSSHECVCRYVKLLAGEVHFAPARQPSGSGWLTHKHTKVNSVNELSELSKIRSAHPRTFMYNWGRNHGIVVHRSMRHMESTI